MVATRFSRSAMQIAVALGPERLVCRVPAVFCDDRHGDRGIAGGDDHDLAQAATPEDFRNPVPAAEGAVQLSSGDEEFPREPYGADLGVLVMDLDESYALLPQRSQISGPHIERCPALAGRFHFRSGPTATTAAGWLGGSYSVLLGCAKP